MHARYWEYEDQENIVFTQGVYRRVEEEEMYRCIDVVIKLYKEHWSLEEGGWLILFRVGCGGGGAGRVFKHE